jgi:hypothetical protein
MSWRAWLYAYMETLPVGMLCALFVARFDLHWLCSLLGTGILSCLCLAWIWTFGALHRRYREQG